jgi:hypothetical protein
MNLVGSIVVMAAILIVCGYIFMREHNNTLGVYRTFKTDEATQGVVVDDDYIYAIGNRKIGKYNKKNGKKIMTRNTNFKHFNAGKVLDDKLYVTHNPEGEQNSVVVFDTDDLTMLESINVDTNGGSLTWIDHDGSSWWGCVAYYDDEVGRTRLVKFNSNWKVVRAIKYPKVLTDKFKPNSNSGGQFIGKGLVALTGHDKKELYVVSVGNNMKLEKIIDIPFTGQGISVDDQYLYGTIRSSKNVIAINFPYT